jgi:phasin protein
MTTTQQDKPGGKPRRRSRKAEPRNRKGGQPNGPAPDHREEDQIRPKVAATEAPEFEQAAAVPLVAEVDAEQVGLEPDQPCGAAPERQDEDAIRPLAASNEAPEIEAAPLAAAPLVGELLPPDTMATGAAEPVEVVSLQTIANAYTDYARASLQESRSCIEKLMLARSFDKAIELQSEFARQAYANFVAESQKIFGLYARWARQNFRPWQFASAKPNEARRQSW